MYFIMDMGTTNTRLWLYDEENELGVRCVALALPGPGGKADAAFSISSLTPQMNHERIAQLAERALVTRRAILQDMGLRVR